MILRRCLVAAACAVTLVTPVVPAGAQTPPPDPCASSQASAALDPSITVWQPAPKTSDAAAHQCTPPSGTPLTGSWAVHFDAASVATLESFAVAIVPASGSTPVGAGATTVHSFAGGLLGGGNHPLTDTIQMTWNTSSLTPYNGEYQISATAQSLLGITAHALLTKMLVNNPPGQPAGPSVILDGSIPDVLWSANPEPDITGYQVLRSVGAGAYTQVGTSQANSFLDTNAPLGKPLTYEIVAVRRSPVDPNGITSAASASSAAVVPSPPLPTNTVAPAPRVVARSAPRSVAAPVDNGSTTFAPTLPYTQALPTTTATTTVTDPGTATITLPAEGKGQTTLLQKVTYLGIAVVILVIAAFIVRYALRLRRG